MFEIKLYIAFLKNKWKNFNDTIFFLFLNLYLIKKSNINIFFIIIFSYINLKNTSFLLSEDIIEKENLSFTNNSNSFYALLIIT